MPFAHAQRVYISPNIITASEELMKMLNEQELENACLLVLANKQDLPSAKSVAEITDKLGLHSLRNRQWYIQATCATSGTLHCFLIRTEKRTDTPNVF